MFKASARFRSTESGVYVRYRSRKWCTTARPSRSVGATPGAGSADEASAARLNVATLPTRRKAEEMPLLLRRKYRCFHRWVWQHSPHSSRCPMAVLVASKWTQWLQPRHRQLARHLRQRQAVRTTQFLVPPVAEEVVPLLLLLPERRAYPLPCR